MDMNHMRIDKKLAILMCVIFSTHLIELIYGVYAGSIMYNFGAKVFSIGRIIFDLSVIVCAYVIASKKVLYLTERAKIASWVFFGLQIFRLFNILCYTVFDNNVSVIIGPAANIIFSCIFACSTVWFYASLHMWAPAKIFGIISALPPIASGILVYQIVAKDYSEDLLPIFDAIATTAWISAALYTIALILSIIWALRKPFYPNVQSNPIDII